MRRLLLSASTAKAAAAWMAIVVIEIALTLAVSGSVLYSTDISPGARLTLLAYDLSLLAVAVGVTAAILGLVRLPRDAHPIARVTTAIARVFVIGVPLFLYAVSWAAFWNAGVFLDRSGLLFWLPHPIQVFHWVYPPVAIGVIVAALAAGAVIGWLVPRVMTAAPAAAQRTVVLAAAALCVICVLATVAGAEIYGGLSPSDPGALPYELVRDQRAGPIAHAAADIRNQFSRDERARSSALADGLPGRAILPMSDYLDRVDLRTLRPLNVLMVQVESLRADQLRAYGGTRDVMPNIDALSREARVFSNAYVQATHSNYADLVPLLSQYPLRSREAYEYPENPTFPRVVIYEVLKAIGYKTAVISSQNERWGGMINFHRPASLDRLFHAEVWDGPTISPFEDAGFANWVKQTRGAGSVDDRFTVDEALKWIDTVGSGPFFLHMNLQSSHVPYVVPEGFRRPFGPDTLDFTIMWGRFPQDKVQIVKDRYADSLFYADQQIGRLFEHLRQRGLWENTLVIVGGDNGEAFYEHGITAHASTVYQEVVKVPMVVRVPGVQAGSDDRPAMFLDVPPSILDLLGMPPHPGFQGISLFDPFPDRNRPVFTMVQSPLADQLCVIRNGFKLIFAAPRGMFLYDLRNDPGEFVNIAALRPDIIEELAPILADWRDRQIGYYEDVSRHSREYPP